MRIEDYALIGDMESAALVGRNGSIDWLCLPRFDSPACFSSLLGDESNGHWTIRPATVDEPHVATRRSYRGETLILDTEWDTPSGTVRVTDFMPPRDRRPDVVRIVEGVSGTVPMRMDLRIRFDYGSIIPWVFRRDDHVVAVAGPDSLWLSTPVPVDGHNYEHQAEFEVRPGDRLAFVLAWNPSHESRPPLVEPFEGLRQTEEIWSDWISRCTYKGPWREAVIRSLITLKALTYDPTGGIVAAPTTSLPEALGGERNWDYRYCWLRDATMTLEALVDCGFMEEARAWREWLLRAIAGRPEDLQIMYGIAGERRLDERRVDWLAGYEGSRPVRVGNAAARQLQLDVHGEVLNALTCAVEAGLEPDPRAWAMLRTVLDWLESNWDQPDEGLWEVRGPRRHFVHSKVMSWVAMDRGIQRVERLGSAGDAARWREVRDRIHAEVCEKGYDPARNTFTQSYGSRELDAATLMIPFVGFLPPRDPRVVGTVEAIQRELVTDGGFVQRYPTTEEATSVDGLSGREGAFLACSFWLADALAMIGRRREATELFERLLALRNDVGLLAEEYDPRHRRLVGNFPQAFSHVPLIDTALRLSADERSEPMRTRATSRSRRPPA